MNSNRSVFANAIRILSMDAVQRANSGHVGMPMGMADIAEVLWNDFLRHNPTNPSWFNRDRFVVSNGHGSMLLYAALHLSGYDLSLEDLKQFRSIHSRTPGHPEYGVTPGVETTTGPLGQGLGNAVGMALAEALLARYFNREQYKVVDHFTYCFVGDGCLMEGVSHEVASLAGTLGLGKLIVFWDDNGISIDGKISNWCQDNTPLRFEAYGWHVISAVDGHQPDQIKAAIQKAQQESRKPTLICCKTVIGFGSPNFAGSEKCHGAPLGVSEIEAVRENLGWSDPPFQISHEIYEHWNARDKGAHFEQGWESVMNAYQIEYPELAKEFMRRIRGEFPANVMGALSEYLMEIEQTKPNMATRKASQKILDHLIQWIPELIGGSADLSESNATQFKHAQVIQPQVLAGNYLHYGVREFGMSTMMNGIALHGGLIPYGGTFLTFMDYARNAVRLACMMKIRVIFVYSHDSIGLGEDGPTHQPIEHLNILRTTPNMSVWRPCDASETAVAWVSALQRKAGPTSLLLTRQSVPHQPKVPQQVLGIYKGGYILQDSTPLDVIVIATGSEVALAVHAAEKLAEENVGVRVVSMPSVDVFLQQSKTYHQEVLPQGVKRVVVEAGDPSFWYQWVGGSGKVIGLKTFGESAPGGDVFESMGLTVEAVMHVTREVVQGEKVNDN